MPGYDVTNEQRALLKSRNFSIRPLATTGYLDHGSVLAQVWYPLLTFFFTFVTCVLAPRFWVGGLMFAIWLVGSIILVIFPTASLFVLLAGIVLARTKGPVKWTAAAYWAWWPFWRFVLVFLSLSFGTWIGETIWYNNFLPYTHLNRFQSYSEIDPSTSGRRLQDAGIVTFNNQSRVAVEQENSGCLKNKNTWCVAPIVPADPADLSSQTNYDLFMAGKDCCTCPGEFKCGDWETPRLGRSVGGFRVALDQDRDMYQLAVKSWGSKKGIKVKHPIFFEWVNDPVVGWKDLLYRGYRLTALACFTAPIILYICVLFVNGALKVLYDFELLIPNEVPVPSSGVVRKLSGFFHPQMHRHQAPEGTADQPADQTRYVVL